MARPELGGHFYNRFTPFKGFSIFGGSDSNLQLLQIRHQNLQKSDMDIPLLLIVFAQTQIDFRPEHFLSSQKSYKIGLYLRFHYYKPVAY